LQNHNINIVRYIGITFNLEKQKTKPQLHLTLDLTLRT